MHTPLRRSQLIIVDESSEDRLFLQMSLEEHFELLEASQAPQGLALLRENQIDLAIVKRPHPLLTQQHYFFDLCEIMRVEHMPVLVVQNEDRAVLPDFFAGALVDEITSLYNEDQFQRMVYHLVNKSQEVKQGFSRQRLQQLSYQHHSLNARAKYVAEFAKQCLYIRNFQSLGRAIAKFAYHLGLTTVLCWRYKNQLQVHHEEPLDEELSKLLDDPDLFSNQFHAAIGRRSLRGDIIILLRNPPSDKRQLIELDATFEEVLHCCEICVGHFHVQQKLSLQSAKLKLINQHFSCGEIQLDRHQHVLDINQRALDLVQDSNESAQGLKTHDFPGMEFVALFEADDQVKVKQALSQPEGAQVKLNFDRLLLSLYPLSLPTNPCKMLVLLNEETNTQSDPQSEQETANKTAKSLTWLIIDGHGIIDNTIKLAAEPWRAQVIQRRQLSVEHRLNVDLIFFAYPHWQAACDDLPQQQSLLQKLSMHAPQALILQRQDQPEFEQGQQLGIEIVLSLPLACCRIDEVVAQLCPDALLGASEPEPEADDQPDFTGITILVADDIAANRVLINLFLADLGCTILEAENGEEAVQLWRIKNPDAILMDLQMPVLDGCAAAKKIRAEEPLSGRKPIPILALSAAGLDQGLKAVEASGMNYFLSKPIDMDELVQLLAHYLLEHSNTQMAPQTSGQPLLLNIEPVPADPQPLAPTVAVKPDLPATEGPGTDTVVVNSDGLNDEALDKLRHSVGQHYPRVLTNFYNDGVLQLQALSLAIAEQNVADLASVAHTIKGSFGNVGADSLSKRSAEIEQVAKEIDDFTRISVAAEMLRSHVEQDLQTLKSRI